MSRILSWKSPKEGPSAFGSDILAFQPTAMEASRRQRDERTAARRAAYKAKVARREAQMGLPNLQRVKDVLKKLDKTKLTKSVKSALKN